jgi:FtsZ-interacting cell division protein ZipA
MSIIQIIVVIGLVAFVIFGLWLQYRIKKSQEGDETEHAERLSEWIRDNPERAEELGYTRKEKNDATE